MRCVLLILMAPILMAPILVPVYVLADEPSPRWWKGNLHTHSLWSDGDDFPEMIADWYCSRDYNFLALSDHNVLSEGIRWMPMKTVIARADASALTKYRQRFGDQWVETRGEPDSADYAVRLKPLDEFRHLLEQRDQFIMIQGEEISDRSEGKPVHINATNVAQVIPPAGGATVREAMQNNLRAILEHEKEHGRQVLPHLNHPNFGYAITAEDLAAVVSERFFEVYNGHPGVNHLGDEKHIGIERMWDLANALRQTELNVPPLLGIATDDSHEYHGQPGSRPGRGWVMVRSRYLTPEHLIRAMKQGDFYASSGVTLSDVRFDESTRTLSLEIDAEPGVTYRTDFVVTLALDAELDTEPEPDAEPKPDTEPDQESIQQSDFDRIGVVVASDSDAKSSFTMSDDQLYVRAVVTSSQPHVDPSFENQTQQAWTQPVGWRE
jgi:hypothetical protein